MADSKVSALGAVIPVDADALYLVDVSGSPDSKKCLVSNFGKTGKHTLFIPASQMRPTVSNGCAVLTDVEIVAGRPDLQVLDFNDSADEHAQFQIAFPISWNLGTLTFKVYWNGVAATTGVAWGLQAVFVGDNNNISAIYGTPIVVVDNSQGSTAELLISAESAPMTVGDTPVDNVMVYFRMFRDIDDGADDMVGDARLIGIKLFFTTDTGNDA